MDYERIEDLAIGIVWVVDKYRLVSKTTGPKEQK